MIETFFAWDYDDLVKDKNANGRASLTECPEVMAISFKFVNTYDKVRGLGLKSVFWLALEF